MEANLKSYQYYSDLYDRHTVEKCRWWTDRPADIEDLRKRHKEKHPDKELDEKELLRAASAFERVHMYFLKGDRYLKKEETIREWMHRDEQSDKFFESATAPENISCLTCGRLMFVSSKHSNAGGLKEGDRVLFFYDCTQEHIPRRAFYDNGEEFRREKPTCPKCKTEVLEEDQTTEEKFVTVITCPNCGYSDTSEIKRTVGRPDPDFEKDRERFCLNEKEGAEFVAAKANMEGMAKLMDEIKEKENNKELYDKVAKLKKLKIVELEELLAPVLEKADYIKLQFKSPEVTKDVFVPFVVYEKSADREGYSSCKDLEKIIKRTLVDTNWRLTTDGVSYRLGMIEGRLHGYEREEDLVKLVSRVTLKDRK
jgi:hypothetical protein